MGSLLKAWTLFLMFGLPLAGAAAADPIGAPRHGPDRWIFGAPDEGYDLRQKLSRKSAASATIPLPRPRPQLPEMTGAIQDEAPSPAAHSPPTASMPQPPPLGVPTPRPMPLAVLGPQNTSTHQPASAAVNATEQGRAQQNQRQTYTAETPKWATVVNGLACDRFRKEADGAWVLIGDVFVRPMQFTLRDPKLSPTTEEAKQLTERCGAAAVRSEPEPKPRSEPVNPNGGAAMPPVAPLE